MKIIAEGWSHKVNANVSLVSLDGPDYWYAVHWQHRGGEAGERYHDRQQAAEFFARMCPEVTERENQKINDALSGFDTYALGYYVNPNC